MCVKNYWIHFRHRGMSRVQKAEEMRNMPNLIFFKGVFRNLKSFAPFLLQTVSVSKIEVFILFFCGHFLDCFTHFLVVGELVTVQVGHQISQQILTNGEHVHAVELMIQLLYATATQYHG